LFTCGELIDQHGNDRYEVVAGTGLLAGVGCGVVDLFEDDPETRVVVVSKLDSSC
jgi:hypothetical protein